MAVEFPDLPFEIKALEPHMSARTLEYHHGKHHKGYVDKLNAALPGSDYEDLSLVEIIIKSHAAGDQGIFNNAAQAWNHTFLWNSLSPNGGGEPGGALAAAINACFGDYAAFREAFSRSAMSQFGSGWTWLVQTEAGLEIISSGNAETPLTENFTPLLTLDVWEHAYYLDHQNRRDNYIVTFLAKLVNWEFAAQNFTADQAVA